VRAFVDAVRTEGADLLADYEHPTVAFGNYGYTEIHGRDRHDTTGAKPGSTDDPGGVIAL
jgi:hypothetical protein